MTTPASWYAYAAAALERERAYSDVRVLAQVIAERLTRDLNLRDGMEIRWNDFPVWVRPDDSD